VYHTLLKVTYSRDVFGKAVASKSRDVFGKAVANKMRHGEVLSCDMNGIQEERGTN
jgi:hypothetical protein